MPQQSALLLPAGVIVSALASTFQSPLVARPLEAVTPIHSTARGKATHYLSQPIAAQTGNQGQSQDSHTQLDAEKSSGKDERNTSEPSDSTLPSSGPLPPTDGAPLQVMNFINYGDEQVAEKWLGVPFRRASATPAPSEGPPPITITGLETPVERISKGVSNGGLGFLVGAIGLSIGIIFCGFGLVLFGLNQAGINGVGAIIAALAFLGVALGVAFVLVMMLKSLG
ncbi:unnamed protein product [Vitrella brassicaformis CCMP3155]|uniref:Uncharacterized protein n=1 Tax=Vitrella brassicaformis (strain CCMP3155) TaxID=1169540 RepID=A0A0G4H533_VITBC|nr:unnamed protein product [Vitrella brassicaformis CCMP3155]|eukprot:CEM38793.1 unnamed protein product [Vitrella brassicaformis CCMP3155]